MKTLPSRCVLALLISLLATAFGAPGIQALVINEIMYHSSETDDRPYEFIELYNENPDPLDLSGYTICNGVSFTFPAGTWLDGRSFLVVCADQAAIRAKYSIDNAIGNWSNDVSLSNGGERIEICNPGGISVVSVRYNDRGKWPAGADGTGHSLSLVNPFVEIDDPDHWRLSLELGGTPGKPNGLTPEEGGVTPSGAVMDGAGFFLKWLVLGPYTGSSCGGLGASLTQDWLRESAGGVTEKDLYWYVDEQVQTNYALAASDGLHPNAGTEFPTVKETSSWGDTINLNDAVWPPDPEYVMAYAFVYVDNMTAAPLPVDIACASDDAISVLVNGTSVHANDACRAVGNAGEVQDRAPATLAVGKNLIAVKVFENTGGWSFRLRLEGRGTGTPITSSSVIRLTTDYTQGFLFGGGGDPIDLPPEPPDPGEAAGTSPVVLNEGNLRTSGERWVEIYNRTGAAVDLSGYHMTDDPSNLTKAALPAVSLPAGGYRAFTDAALGLDFSPASGGIRVFVALVAPDGTVADAWNFEPRYDELSEARIPDGSGEFTDAADPTRAGPNSMTANEDVVLSEIMYHPIDNDPRKEYVELYNRGSQAVDLTGWSISDGISFTFPPGAAIPAGGYLVVARDPALVRAIHGLSAAEVIGPQQTPDALDAFGVLRDAGERITLSDELGRTIDTVRYWDGGDWPRWADGLGSSLELIDPRQDNRLGQAWDASDDSAKAETRTYSYVGRHGGGESELDVLLLDSGITVVDDISIIGGGIQRIDTPLVETGETWRYFKGTEDPPASWKEPGFNDGAWSTGPTGIGYGDSDDATVLSDMAGNYLTIFSRKPFTVADPSAIDELALSVVVDDGFRAYLNGTEVTSYNAGGTTFDSPAPSAIEPTLVERDISSFKGSLRTGTNVLAIQVYNVNLGSTDLSFIPRLVDRTTIVTGGTEQLANGTFESNTAGWMIEGTHIRSGRTTQSPLSGAGSLKIIASGRGDNKVNRIETPNESGFGLSNLTVGEDLQISLKARWVVGSQTLLTHGYEHAMAKAHDLVVPENLGTPGRLNSVTQRLLNQTGTSNLGPVLGNLTQDPAVPGAMENVKVRVEALDADGVSSVVLYYSLTNPSASPSSIAMTHVGGGIYECTVPGQALSTRVIFFIVATDSMGREGRYPVDVTERSHPLLINPLAATVNDHRYAVYRHDVRYPGTSLHSYRVFMSQVNQDTLSSRRLLSNDLVDGSFVFGGDTMYHEAAIRFSGSPFARGGWGASFRVSMPRDRLLHGRIRKFNLDNHHGSGANAQERISHYLIRKNQGSISVPYSDAQTVVRWQVNDAVTSVLEHIWAPDVQFVGLWFPEDDEGDLYEMDDRFVISDAGGLAGNTDARVLFPPPSSRTDGDGQNKENYRWFFGLRAKNGADDFSSLIDFARVMDPAVTSNVDFDAQIWDVCNVEEMLRIWAVRLNTSDWDQWGGGRGKNCYLYRPSIDGRYNLMAWDMELTYGDVYSYLIPDNPMTPYSPGGFGEVNRMLSRPAVQRMYYAILNEMVNGPDRWFHSDHLSTYMEKLSAAGMGNVGIGLPGGFIDSRAALLGPRIQGVMYPQVRLQITTNGGNDFTTSQRTVSLAGTAPADACSIVVARPDGDFTTYPMTFSSMTQWSMSGIPLAPGANKLDLYGFDLRGNFVDTDGITITWNATAWDPPTIDHLDPDGAASGQDIAIVGAGFHDGLEVLFGATESPLVLYDEDGATPDTIIARVPPGAGSVLVKVKNLDGKASAGTSFNYEAAPTEFVRGDTSRDGSLDLRDAVKILLHLYGGLPLDCQDAADVDDSETLNVTDAIRLLEFLFRGGARPSAPFPSPGEDPSGGALGCAG